VGYRSTTYIVDRLERVGAVRIARGRKRMTYVLLDPAFPASEALKRYLVAAQPDRPAFNGTRLRHVWHKRLPRRDGTATPELLFGTAARTRILAFAGVSQVFTAQDVCRSLGMAERLALPTLDFLVSIGLISCRRNRIRRAYSLARDTPGAAELRSLLRRLAHYVPRLDVRAHSLKTAPDIRGNRNYPPAFKDQSVRQKLPFMKPAQARLLGSVASGPLSSAAMARAFGVQCQTVRDTARRLERIGVLRISVGAAGLVASLNSDYPAAGELRALLLAATGTRAAVAVDKTGGIPRAFGSPRRLRVMAALALLGEGDQGQIMNLASPGDGYVRRVIALLARRLIVIRTDRGYQYAPTPLGMATRRLMMRFSHVLRSAV
jgi:hypothetical protein